MGRQGRSAGKEFLLLASAVALLVAGFAGSAHPLEPFQSAVLQGHGSVELSKGEHSRNCCLLGNRPVRDFRLKDLVEGRDVTFLDVARKDFTFLLFVRTGSPECIESMRMLERIRDRYRDKISLVLIFSEPTGSETLLRCLIAHRIYPDFALHDPTEHQAECYRAGRAPSLYVVGPNGSVIFTASCTRPVDLAAFSIRLERVLDSEAAVEQRFQEAQRIYGEALQWFEAGHTEMALLYLERILELQPNLYTVHRTMGDMYYSRWMRRQAHLHYSRYLRADRFAYDSHEVRQVVDTIVAEAFTGYPLE